MWSSSVLFRTGMLAAFLASAGCTVEPLNASAPSGLSSGTQAFDTRAALREISVDPVSTRVAQQVRNRLLFSMHGGAPVETGKYALTLTVRNTTRVLATPLNGDVAKAAQVRVEGAYLLRERSNGAVVAKGRRAAVAAYDRTDQLFANKRAERDAQNRAAFELAERLRVDLAQRVAGL